MASGEAPAGGYPYASAACEFGAAGGPDCANPDDPGDAYNWGYGGRGSGGAGAFRPSDPWGYEYRNCTSYVAWRLAEAGVPGWLFRDLGNASQWLTSVAGEPGVTISHVPSAGAVAVWVLAHSVGHVAWVDSASGSPASRGTVSGSGVTVSDYNDAGTGEFATHAVTSPPTAYIRFPLPRHPAGSSKTRYWRVVHKTYVA